MRGSVESPFEAQLHETVVIGLNTGGTNQTTNEKAIASVKSMSWKLCEIYFHIPVRLPLPHHRLLPSFTASVSGFAV